VNCEDVLRGETLPRAFYMQPTLRVARLLLGKVLVHEGAKTLLAGRIVEVEAYRGPADRAAHSYGGRRSARNEAMYGAGGFAYVYLIYGVHHCFNVVCQPEGVPEAVLIRALEPVAGLSLMRRRRRLRGGGVGTPATLTSDRLCRGPGSLCRAMGIDRRHDGVDLTRGTLRILDAPDVAAAARSRRIGVAYAGPDAVRPWRLYVAGHPCVSAAPR
jgi:DNA-3-methyladenine glycosylase